MLHLVLGRSGYGKTTFIREKIKQKVGEGGRVILIVPEQFSFESERALYFELGAKSSMQVEVLSFSRLAHNIFREYGGIASQYVSDGGKNILMQLAFDELKGTLSLYNQNTSGAGFIKCITGAVSELKQYGISPHDLIDTVKNMESSPLKDKTTELASILETYNAMLSRGYADTDDDLKRALELLRQHSFFDGTYVFVDEFKGFTSVEIDILGCCIAGAVEVWTSFCTTDRAFGDEDTKPDDTDIFSGINNVINLLKNKAKEAGVTVRSPVRLDEPYRYKNESLTHIERNLFRPQKKALEVSNPSVQIYAAKNYYREMEYIASKIKLLVRENGLNYRDIAVIGRNIDDYKVPLKSTMNRYDIPIFYNVNQSIMTKPLPSFILSLLRACIKNYDNDEVFAALKTGLVPLTTEQISLTENYVFMWNIKGKMWEVPFAQNPRGFVGEFTDEDMEELETINYVREYIHSAVKDLKKATAKCSGTQFVNALYDCLEKLGIPDRYVEIIKSAETQNLADSYTRVWDLFCDTLEEMEHILKNTVLAAAKFTELLEIMLETLDMGDIPQTLDQVLVGDASLVRPNSPAVVFAIGMNDGVFPMIPESTGIFSDSERKQLIEMGLKLSDPMDKKIIDEQFIAYKTLTSASQNLCISYSNYDLKGTPLYPSGVVEQILSIIPNTPMLSDRDIKPEFYCQNYSSSYHTLAQNFRKDTPERATLTEYFQGHDSYREGLSELEKAAAMTVFKIEDKQIASSLFGKTMRLSPSKVEQYHKCSFAYFIQNGLGVNKRKKAELSFLEIGSLIHYALQYLLQKYGGKGITTLTQEKINEEINNILLEYIGAYMGGIKNKTKRFKYLYTRLSNTLTKLIAQLAAEFKQSEFEPADFELKVGNDGEITPLRLALPTGGNIRVEGIIDRVDIMTKGKQKYIRIVDYKTGAKDFKLSDVYYGINMQMLIYLFSLWQNGGKRYGDIVPAGILYMPAKTTPIEADRYTTSEKLKELSIKSFKMHGLILDDPDIIRGMDKSAKGLFINVSLDKNGKPKNKEAVASLAELGKLKEYTQNLLIKMAEELRDGKIDANPNVSGQFKACDYCGFQSICGHEASDSFSVIESMNKETFFENIEGDENGN